MKTIVLMIFVSVFLVAGQLFLKHAAQAFNEGMSLLVFKNFIISKELWISLVCISAAALLWIYVLSYEKISLAYPLVSFSYVFMALAMYFIFHEMLTVQQYLGILFIVLGTTLLYI